MNRTSTLRVRVTENELQQLEALSIALFGIKNKSKLLRKLVRDYIGMGPDLIDSEMQAFKDSIRQLTGIARNLNQITARVHENPDKLDLVTVNKIDDLKEYVECVNESVKDYVNRTVHRCQGVRNDR